MTAGIKRKLKAFLIRRILGGTDSTPARPTRNFSELFSHVKKLGFQPGTVLDVGAASGTLSLHEAFPDADFILFEPLKAFSAKLGKLKSKYRVEIHNCALSSKSKKGTIVRSKDLDGSSILHDLDKNDERLESIDIKTLDEVLKGKKLKKPVLLKTDCQGADFDVIKGGVKTLKECELVIMEVSFFKFRGKKHSDPLEILNYMDKAGFCIYDILDGLYRPFDGALGQVDFVFVKKNSVFKSSAKW